MKSKPSEELVNDGEAFDDKGSTGDGDYDFEYDDVRPASVDRENKEKRNEKGILMRSKPSEELDNDGEAFDDKGSTGDGDYDFEYDDVEAIHSNQLHPCPFSITITKIEMGFLHGCLWTIAWYTAFIPVYPVGVASETSEELVNDGEAFDDKGSTGDGDYDFEYDDVRPANVDEKIRKKEMRKGIDLPTGTYIENFVITDLRLPDNPIVRMFPQDPETIPEIYVKSGTQYIMKQSILGSPTTPVRSDQFTTETSFEVVDLKHALAVERNQSIGTYLLWGDYGTFNESGERAAKKMIEKESYLTIKERLYNVKENSTATTILHEEVLRTPRGVEFKIPEFSVAPPPPKKSCLGAHFCYGYWNIRSIRGTVFIIMDDCEQTPQKRPYCSRRIGPTTPLPLDHTALITDEISGSSSSCNIYSKESEVLIQPDSHTDRPTKRRRMCRQRRAFTETAEDLLIEEDILASGGSQSNGKDISCRESLDEFNLQHLRSAVDDSSTMIRDIQDEQALPSGNSSAQNNLPQMVRMKEMKPEYTSLNKLTDKSKDYKVKVKVIDKNRPLQTPKKTRYQRLVLKDDEGNTIRGTLFGNDIESFEQALQKNGEYEISGAPIQQIPVEHQKKPNEYQIIFNERARITPLATNACWSEPNYLKLAAIPWTQTVNDESLDIIAIVVFVSDVYPVKRNSVEYSVRKVLLLDDNCQRPITLSAWNDLAHVECETLSRWSTAFVAIGFTGIRVAPYKEKTITPVEEVETKKNYFDSFTTDGIGAIKATAFGEEVELLLGVSSDKLFSMKKSADENLLEEELSKVRKAKKLIQI
ncbi:Phototropin-1 [Bienertia sinuspersici]